MAQSGDPVCRAWLSYCSGGLGLLWRLRMKRTGIPRPYLEDLSGGEDQFTHPRETEPVGPRAGTDTPEVPRTNPPWSQDGITTG